MIVAVASGDRGAFATLFGHFAPRIKTMMLRSGLSDPVAEDLAQDTMLAVWNKARLFDPAGSGPSAWIYRIAHNLRVDTLRRVNLGIRAEAEADLNSDAAQALPDAQLAASEMEGQVRAALASLSADQIQVLTMSFFESRPHPEIAQRLGIPLGTVKSRLRLAMSRLRALLETSR